MRTGGVREVKLGRASGWVLRALRTITIVEAFV
jgi:hypothetical protein